MAQRAPAPTYEAILQLLIEAGVTEGGVDAKGEPFEDEPPGAMAGLLFMAVHAQASAPKLVDLMSWGQPHLVNPIMLALADKLVALRDAPPA